MKRFALLVLWFFGVGAATAVAWAGVSVVENQIIDPPPAIAVDQNPASEDRAETLPPDRGSTSSSAMATTTLRSLDDSTSAPSTSISATTNTAPSTTTNTSTTNTSTSTSTSTSTTTIASSSSSSTTGEAPQATSQTFTLVGGTTAISFSPEGVSVLWATPEPGFDVRIEPEQPGIKVEFRAEHHRSRIDAWWASGPRHEIDEEPRD